VNANNEYFLVKFHVISDEGFQTITQEEAAATISNDPEYLGRDLFNHIEKGGKVADTCYIQLMHSNDISKCTFNPFDATKTWPHGEYPLIEFGKIHLNKNVENFFAEVEQVAFSPANLVPGIQASPDKVLQGRLFSYYDTHRHRLGANYTQIPINCPFRAQVTNYERDGPLVVKSKGNAVNYFPNSESNSPVEDPTAIEDSFPVTGKVIRSEINFKMDDFYQPRIFYTKVLNNEQKELLVKNIVKHLKDAKFEIQERQVRLFSQVDTNFGERVAKGLGFAANVIENIRHAARV